MITLNRRTNVYVAKGPTDMRASYDTLSPKAGDILKQDPFSGYLFVFLNARRTSCKCLYFDGTGLVIIAKRLEKAKNLVRDPFPGGRRGGGDSFLNCPKLQVNRLEPKALLYKDHRATPLGESQTNTEIFFIRATVKQQLNHNPSKFS